MAPPPPPAVTSYLNLSTAERASAQALPALLGLFQSLATGYEPPVEQRRKLLAALLASAPPLADNPNSTPLLFPLCSTLKLLGRSPAGSEELGRQNGLKTLLQLGGLARLADLDRPAFPRRDSQAEEEGQDDGDETATAEKVLTRAEKDPLAPAESEALRCLCNILTLHPAAREIFPEIILADEKRVVLRGLIRLLATNGAGFLAGRLLFLLTSKASEAVTELVVGGDCVEVMEEFARRYLSIYNSPNHRQLLSSGPPATTMDDILREHLKLAYNLMLQYSRQPSAVPEAFSKGDGGKKKRFWRSRDKSSSGAASAPNSPDLALADGGEGKIDELSLSSSPPRSANDAPRSKSPAPRSKSPLSFAKRAVDAVKQRTGGSSASPDPSSKGSPSLRPSPSTSSPSAPASPNAAQEGTSPDALSLTASHLFLPLFQPYLSISVLLPLLPEAPSPAAPPATYKDPSPAVRAALATLLNFPVELEELSGWSNSWLQYVPSRLADDGFVLKGGGIGSLGERLLVLLEGVCEAYFPAHKVPDKPKLLTKRDREQGKTFEAPVAPDEWIPTGEGLSTKIEEILGPVMLLLRKMSMLGEAQFVFRELLLPANLDRTRPLDRHPTLTGHLVRLLSSTLLPNTSYGVGEFIYNLCDRDPLTLVRAIGYGNASGFLQNRGELIPPPAGEEVTPEEVARNQRSINPITGAFEAEDEEEQVPMSEEEKEREAEKLYTLFERMSKTGVIEAANPVDKARAEGQFEETKADREAELERIRQEDEEIEKEVERDMAAWRQQRKKVTQIAGQ
ncbi:hypothetical protein JCM11641_004149 [Rhodosporidiobolus odoratus]